MLETKFINFTKIDLKSQTSFLNQFVIVAIQFHQRVSTVFLPTAIKFHYLFNLRDLSNIIQVIKLLPEISSSIKRFPSQGMLFASSKDVVHPQDLIQLYIHEAERTYADKLISQEDMDLFEKILRETIRKNFEVNYFEHFFPVILVV